MRIEPDKWLAEYEATLEDAHEPALRDYEREGLLRTLGWFAKMSDEHQAEAVRCMVICAIRACGDFYRGLSRADSWIESAELGNNPELCASMGQAMAEMRDAAERKE